MPRRTRRPDALWTRVAPLLVLLVHAPARAALAQPAPYIEAHEPAPGFLSRLLVRTSMEALSEHDEHFYWDADVGVGLDVVDYGRGFRCGRLPGP